MALPDISAFQLLDADPDPCCVIDLSPHPQHPLVAWSNKVLHGDTALKDAILHKSQTSDSFRQWLRGAADARTFTFSTKVWTTFRYQEQWAVVRAQPCTAHDLAGTDSNDKSAPLSSGPSSQSRWPGLMTTQAHAGPDDIAMDSDVRLRVFDHMMQMSDVGVFEFYPDGRLMHANESWYRLSGHPRDSSEYLDFSFMDLVHEDDVALVTENWNALAQGSPVTFEMRWKVTPQTVRDAWPEGDGQWVLASCVPVKNGLDQVISIAGNTVDLSLQKRSVSDANQRTEALQRARESESKFARFAQLAPIAIYIFDAHHACQFCNDQFFEMTGHPKVAIEDVDWRAFTLAEDIHIVEEGVKTLFVDKKSSAAQIRLNRTWEGPDGIHRQAWAQFSSFPELDADGEIQNIFGTLMDISQFKFAETLQKVRVDEAVEAKRQQESFIDTTSHEMRNPLSAVVQCADSTVDSLTEILVGLKHISMTQGPGISENVEGLIREAQSALGAAQTIISCSTHQRRIIDDVLTLSKLDSDLLLVTPVKVKPTVVIMDAIKMFELECSRLDIALGFEQDASLAALETEWVLLDPSRLVQVLINLLTNAIKFTQGRSVRRITVRVGFSNKRPSSDLRDLPFDDPPVIDHGGPRGQDLDDAKQMYLWVSVEDTGCGLTSSQRLSLFARFSQATPRTHIKYGGSGLGLFISKSLALKQGGDISVRSEADVGSTFAFFISIRLAFPDWASPGVLSAGEPIPVGESVEERVKAARYSVLIVEDNVTNQRVLARQLEKAGCLVRIANHGKEALEHLEQTVWWKGKQASGADLSLILMDIEMPVMDGKTCARTIRSLQASGDILGHVPILAVSANARSEQVKEALAVGMDDAIAKPFRLAELLPKLYRLARKRKFSAT